MTETAYGPWDSLPLMDAVALFTDAPFRWWVSGGHALDLHLGQHWRSHSDTDISFRRTDIHLISQHLAGWEIHLAAAGVLSRWQGQTLVAERSENNLWCRRGPDSPWRLDLTIGDGDDTEWIFRRDPTVRLQWSQAILLSDHGIPYLAPELQLLFKSKQPRAKDHLDVETVIPLLARSRRANLEKLLAKDHQWQSLLSEAHCR